MEAKNPYRTKRRPNNSYATIYEKGRTAGIEEETDFIVSYVENKGTIIDKYSDRPHHIAQQWQFLVGLLDRIRWSELKSNGV